MLSLRMNEFKLMFIRADFDWMMKILLIFLLYINRNGMVVNEFYRLV